jgi:hypothetical protein
MIKSWAERSSPPYRELSREELAPIKRAEQRGARPLIERFVLIESRAERASPL